MVIACKALNVEGRKILPGEEVPGFYSWSQTVQRAHINLGWVKIEKEELNPEVKEQTPGVMVKGLDKTYTVDRPTKGNRFKKQGG